MCQIRTETPSTVLSPWCSLLYISLLHLHISLLLSNFLFLQNPTHVKKKSPISKFHESTHRKRERSQKNVGEKGNSYLNAFFTISLAHTSISPSAHCNTITQALTDDPTPKLSPMILNHLHYPHNPQKRKRQPHPQHTQTGFLFPSHLLRLHLPLSHNTPHKPVTHTHRKNALTSSSLSCFKNATGDSGTDSSSRPPAFFSRMLILPVQAAHPRTSLRLTCHRQALDTLVDKQQEAWIYTTTTTTTTTTTLLFWFGSDPSTTQERT